MKKRSYNVAKLSKDKIKKNNDKMRFVMNNKDIKIVSKKKAEGNK